MFHSSRHLIRQHPLLVSYVFVILPSSIAQRTDDCRLRSPRHAEGVEGHEDVEALDGWIMGGRRRRRGKKSPHNSLLLVHPSPSIYLLLHCQFYARQMSPNDPPP